MPARIQGSPGPGRFVTRALILCAVLSGLASRAAALEKRGTVYTTDGSQADVEAAIADAAAGDTVTIPPGTFTYGTGGDYVGIGKPITLAGSGRDATTVVIADSSGTWTNAAIRLWAAATVRDFTVRGSSAGIRAPFAAAGSSGWRITDIEFNQTPGKGSYFLYAGGVFGLVDNCTINGAAGNNELIFTRGPENAWQTDDTIGTAQNVYIEDCTFNGDGYVCDINSNGKAVVRFCTINGPMKVDGHGKASNSPPRGVRHMEVHHNVWTSTNQGGWLTVEMRGGTGHVFSNTAARGTFMLREYAMNASWPNFGRIMTPKDYPVDDQIGTGKDPKAGGAEPMYVWGNRVKSGEPWRLYDSPSGAQATALNGGVAFHDSDLVAPDRDYFREVAGGAFDGTSGMGVGTRAKMRRIRPKRKGVGYWVTDEGEWNARHPGPDGRLYTWDGRRWALKYTPYAYPHPLRKDDSVKGAPARRRRGDILHRQERQESDERRTEANADTSPA